MLRSGFQSIQGDVHRTPGRLTDVDLINHLDVNAGDSIANIGVVVMTE